MFISLIYKYSYFLFFLYVFPMRCVCTMYLEWGRFPLYRVQMENCMKMICWTIKCVLFVRSWCKSFSLHVSDITTIIILSRPIDNHWAPYNFISKHKSDGIHKGETVPKMPEMCAYLIIITYYTLHINRNEILLPKNVTNLCFYDDFLFEIFVIVLPQKSF